MEPEVGGSGRELAHRLTTTSGAGDEGGACSSRSSWRRAACNRSQFAGQAGQQPSMAGSPLRWASGRRVAASPFAAPQAKFGMNRPMQHAVEGGANTAPRTAWPGLRCPASSALAELRAGPRSIEDACRATDRRPTCRCRPAGSRGPSAASARCRRASRPGSRTAGRSRPRRRAACRRVGGRVNLLDARALVHGVEDRLGARFGAHPDDVRARAPQRRHGVALQEQVGALQALERQLQLSPARPGRRSARSSRA